LLVHAGLSAARASFPTPRSRLAQARLRALTALLHLLQPLARVRGRQQHGLTPWRRLSSRKTGRGFRLPWPRTRTLWSERWQAPTDRLRTIEAALQTSGTRVRRGGDYDRWDLEVGRGILGGARMRLVAEEHGHGRQLVRVRTWPCFSAKGLVIALVYATLSILAAHASVWSVAAALGGVVLLLALQTLHECGAATDAVLRVFENDRGGRDSKQGRAAVVSYSDITLYRRLLRQVRPYRLHIVGIFLLSLLQSPLALLTPLPLKIAVDNMVGSHHLPSFLALLLPASATLSHTAVLILAAGLFVAVALLSQLQQLGTSVLSTYTGERLVLDFRTQLFGHVQRLSLAHHDTQGTADSTYRIQYDAMSIQTIAIGGVIPFISAAVTLAGMIYVTARIDGQLALVALAVSPVLFLVSRAYRRRLRSQSRAVKKLESSALGVVQEVLAAVRVVKAFGQEEREQERFVRRSSAGMWARIRYAVDQGIFGLLVGLTTAVGTAAVLFIGMRHVQADVLTLGDLLLVMGYLAQLYAPLKTIGSKAATLQAALASAERAFSLLDEAPGVAERPDARPLGRAKGTVTFQGVSFAYGQDRPVLHEISFAIGAGTRLGIVGTTGAGKTTLVSLLTRFYDPTGGRILLDGVDLCAYKLADLRNQFAIVLQEPVLFSTSIAENIAYGRPDAGDDEIVAAARAANAHDFIVNLPQGYETLVGERGMRLSGGERQRISLARAFLKDAPILILDEPTSSVDTKTEAAIMDAMERLMQGRTTVMIAHRLSTLAHCDARLEMEHGRLVQTSPPARGG
ncbi:MAG TPA: ABC transporter ATP-binding protein, partial [Chloroflexota bacterium]|nr:ABC transporter ATP-binding protein [Chloroflexota bacterium]